MKNKDLKEVELVEGESSTSDSSEDITPIISLLHKKTSRKRTRSDKEERRLLPWKQFKGGLPNPHYLATQFASLCRQVEIPSAELKPVFDLLPKIEEIVRNDNPNIDIRVTLFRHFYLKLRDPFVVCHSDSNQRQQLLMYLSDKNYQPLKLSNENLQQLFADSQFTPVCSESEDENIEEVVLIDKQSDIKFKLVTDVVYQTEVVTCELMKYLLKFDPRAKSLLILLRYWGIENNVTLSEEDTPNSLEALDWMCLFYLGKEKVIPMPLKIMNRLRNGHGVSGVPFEEDKNFIQNWKESHKVPREGTEDYVKNILHLAAGFFHYFTSSNFRSVVLKTRDIVRDFISGRKWQDKMYLMQPVASTRRFPVCQEKFEEVVQPLMRKTLAKLNVYLKNLQLNKPEAKVDLKFLFQCENGNLDVPYDELLEMELELKPKVEEAEEEIRGEEEQLEQHNVFSTLCDCECDDSAKSTGCDESFLLHKFSILMKDIVIPETELKRRENLQNFLNNFLDRNVYPRCKLLTFRNGPLGLNYDDDDLIYFFVDYPGLYSKDATGTRHILFDNEKSVKLIDAIKTLGNYSEEAERLLLAPLEEASLVVGNEEKFHVFHCEEETFPFKFCIATPSYLPEVQASRLVQYLSTFDPRVKPLIALILRWAKINQIQLGMVDAPNRVGFAPDSSLLEWLVICYLCGKEVIPTPEDILASHSDGKLIFDGVNIGFKIDPQLARDWRRRRSYNAETSEEEILNVIELAQSFFRLWRKFGEKAKIHPRLIDLKSCRWFRKDELKLEGLETNEDEAVEGSLQMQSNDILKRLHSEPSLREKFFCGNEGVTILHPLYVKYGFSFCSDNFLNVVCPKMWATEKKLQDMLEDYKNYVKAKIYKHKPQKLSYTLESILLI